MIIRLAEPRDAAQMATLLNAIIAAGGTTAHQTPFDEGKMHDHYIAGPTQICCHVADADGVVLGFQHLDGPDPGSQAATERWAYIASFVANSAAGKGVGQHLFAATREAAAQAMVVSIDATIRADNVPGLRYYSGLGFVDFDRVVDVPLRDGTPVDRIKKRYDLPMS